MLTVPMDVLTQFPVRKTKKQKRAFREDLRTYVNGLGYSYAEEKGSRGSRNVVIGDPKTAKYLITAHYDTCAHLPFPNFITPCNMGIYLAYQILLVTGMFVIAGLIGWLVQICTNSMLSAYYVGLLVYWAILLLMMFGPANRHNANDNTSGVVTALEIARSLPVEQRHKVCFVLFDLEEAGLLGSASYRKAHKKATDSQVILNLDCVGDGDEIVMFPTKKLKKSEMMGKLDAICGQFGEKSISLHKKGFAFCPSDQSRFPHGVGIMAFHRRKGTGLYCSRIHTNRDTILEEKNVSILTEALMALLCQ